MEVVRADLGVTVKVGFMPTIQTKVMVDMVVRTAVIIVQTTTVSSVIGDDEVMMHLVEGGDRRRSSVSHGGDVRQAVPRVECAI